MKESLSACPSCEGPLVIRSYQCRDCGTEVHGSFSGCPFCSMPDEDRYFCLVFLQCEGNMKDVESVMGISYPTIKNRLLKIKRSLERWKHGEDPAPVTSDERAAPENRDDPRVGEQDLEILEALEAGKIDFSKALELLRDGNRKS